MYYRFVWQFDRTMANSAQGALLSGGSRLCIIDLCGSLIDRWQTQRRELCCREVSDYVLSICVAACSSDGKSWNTSPTIIEVSAMGALLSRDASVYVSSICVAA
ncbi:hypothetical protein [Candidatus Epulonipiscium viviparus]|uniref:hypothetical protein n=1 Tax=Candidatus Epulonipiscium viviparus TaxID=420336 RepID=UPI0027380EEB|nr:hypothetical protein [Candidatus Epulopiscium viviparus]